MKFLSSFSLLTLSIGAVSGSDLARRDLATIESVLTTVSGQVNSLDVAVRAFRGDAGPVTSASNTLLSTIRSGISAVSATSPLNQNDALTIATFVTGLNSSVATVVNDLIIQQSALAAACAAGTVLQQLTEQKAASTELANAITNKVPTDLQALAGQLSAGIADSLQAGINAFQGSSSGTCSSTTGGAAPLPTLVPSAPWSSTESASAPPVFETPSSPSAPTYPSSSAPIPSSYPSSSGSVDLPPVYIPSSSEAASQPTGGYVPSAPTGGSGGPVRTGLSSPSDVSAPSPVSPYSSASSTPAVYTGAASVSNVGTSTLAFIVGCIALFM